MSADLNSAAMDAIRKACNEIMGGNCAFIDDDFARCLYTMKEQRDALQKRCEQLEEALRQGSLQLEMAADCIENRRYDEALLHCRSLVRLREAALSKGRV